MTASRPLFQGGLVLKACISLNSMLERNEEEEEEHLRKVTPNPCNQTIQNPVFFILIPVSFISKKGAARETMPTPAAYHLFQRGLVYKAHTLVWEVSTKGAARETTGNDAHPCAPIPRRARNQGS